MKPRIDLVPQELIERRILIVRGHKVMLSVHLVELFGVETRVLHQAVKRNVGRFPEDLMFQLTEAEANWLVSQNVMPHRGYLGGSLPIAFTEQGVAMLSSVLRSERADEDHQGGSSEMNEGGCNVDLSPRNRWRCAWAIERELSALPWRYAQSKEARIRGRDCASVSITSSQAVPLLHLYSFASVEKVKVDDIISYHELVAAEKANLQKGMNFGIGKDYSDVLMSLRRSAPCSDAIDLKTGMLTYEGHDVKRTKECPDPKDIDQPLATQRGSWTENGKFFRAAMDYKGGLRKKPELVKVYEKIARGIWCYKGFFELEDAAIVSDGKRNVFKFCLNPVEKKLLGRVVELPHTRLIPTHVKKSESGNATMVGVRSVNRLSTFISITKYPSRRVVVV
jgi:hypothetical protein